MNSALLRFTCSAFALLLAPLFSHGAEAPAWRPGEPIVTYWAGPGFPGGGPLNDAAATQLKDGGWNLVWCPATQLDVAGKHGLRALLTDPLLSPASLDDPAQTAALEALVSRVKTHPATYAYHLTDEPSAELFPALGKLVAFLKERDPAHPAYINLLPTYANNEQLGIAGGKVEAYTEHLKQFIDTVHPALLSYDHYQFTNAADNPDYFLNLALMRKAAQQHGLPFLNIVQASCWVPGSAASPAAPRVPGPDELRYLVYTTAACDAQGISYYVYSYPGHEGGMALADGTTTRLYTALKSLNREFAAIAREVQPLKSSGAWHAGMLPPGTEPLPAACPFQPATPEPAREYKPGERVLGILVGTYGPGADAGSATHAVVVNLDYKTPRTLEMRATGEMEILDTTTGKWTPSGRQAALDLKGGEGRLLRLRR